MKFAPFILAAACAGLTPVAASADTYPSKPITMIVPSAPAGSTDIMARLIGEQLSRAMGQPVLVDNRPGASGNIGTEAVARAAPDGYTLLMQYSGYHVGNPALFPQIRWSPTKDFAPVAMVMRAPHVIAVSGALPVTSMKDLIEYGKKKNGGLFYASSGNGSIQHIAGELLSRQIKQPMTHVPYKGAGPAINDLIGGNVDIFITTPPSVPATSRAARSRLSHTRGRNGIRRCPTCRRRRRPGCLATRSSHGSRSSPPPRRRPTWSPS